MSTIDTRTVIERRVRATPPLLTCTSSTTVAANTPKYTAWQKSGILLPCLNLTTVGMVSTTAELLWVYGPWDWAFLATVSYCSILTSHVVRAVLRWWCTHFLTSLCCVRIKSFLHSTHKVWWWINQKLTVYFYSIKSNTKHKLHSSHSNISR